MDDWWPEPSIFLGFGQLHDLRDADHEPPRTAGFKSVKTHTTLQRDPKPRQQPVGFHRPSRQK